MNAKKVLGLLIGLLVVLAAGAIVVKFYEYVFSKTVSGVIVNVERVSEPIAIMPGQGNIPPSQIFSFAVAIKDSKGEIHTASSEDRQWAVAQPGQCVDAKFYPYPPWNLAKAGTFHGARLLGLRECAQGEKASTAPTAPSVPSASTVPAPGSASTAPESVPSGAPSPLAH